MKQLVQILLACLLAAAARAEVRLVARGSGPVLTVQPTARGVWTPTHAADELVVNPDGDLIGDGSPAHATAGGRLVAAWQRPSTNAVAVLTATSPRDRREFELPAEHGVGLPVIAADDSSALVIWQESEPEPAIAGAVVSELGVVPIGRIVSGRLIDVAAMADFVYIVAFDPRSTHLTVVTLGYAGYPIPIPGVQRAPLRNGFAVDPFPHGAVPGFLSSPSTWVPCIDAQGDEVTIAWESSRGVIGRIVLDTAGVHGAGEFFRGPNGSCQAVLNAAERH